MTDVTTPPPWPPRSPDANKGTYGRVAIIAGSRGMSGAATLAARACLRGGAGLVRVACPASVQPLVAVGEPCAMTIPTPEDDEGRFAVAVLPRWLALSSDSDVVALGPGLGRSSALDALVPAFLAQRDRPMVVDADALNAMVGREDAWAGPTPVVITPHPGEFGRLTGLATGDVQRRRRESAVDFAKRHGLIVVLKGHGTIVTDGTRVYRNTTGNPGMATAGAGDVLTGLLAAVIAQGFDPFEAAVLAVWCHGRAGDWARDSVGEVSLIASDLVENLAKAIQEAQGKSSVPCSQSVQ